MGPCRGLILCIQAFFSSLSMTTGRMVIPGVAITIRENTTWVMPNIAAVLLFITGVPGDGENKEFLSEEKYGESDMEMKSTT